MDNAKNKSQRYKNLIKRISNWHTYLINKMLGFKKGFNFKVKGFRNIFVPKKMIGTFRENFLDDIYFKYIPAEIFDKRDQPIILDVGANVGFFSLAAFSRFQGARVYGVEPHPFCFETLERYKTENDDLPWYIYNVSLGEQGGEITINTSTLDGFATMSSIFESESNKFSFTVPSRKLGPFLKENNIDRADFAKFDCEGSEYPILYSLDNEDLNKINSMCVETHQGQNEKQTTEALASYLSDHGFTTKILKVTEHRGYIWAWKNN